VTDNNKNKVKMEEAYKRVNDCAVKNRKVLMLNDLNLTELPAKLPSCITNLYCSGNKLTKLPDNLPATLQCIDCSNNRITKLPDNLNLLKLSCSYNMITELPSLPDCLMQLECNNNLLIRLPDVLPEHLEELDCSHNKLMELPTMLPKRLLKLFCNNNKLTKLPDIPECLRELRYRKNNNLFVPAKVIQKCDNWRNTNSLYFEPSIGMCLRS
jgi:Leucine-rich repeat (LRR) protein